MGLTPWVCQTLRVLVASLTPTGSDTARSFTADGEQTLLLQLKIWLPSHSRGVATAKLVTVAPTKLIAQPESVIGLETCPANFVGPCLEQQA